MKEQKLRVNDVDFSTFNLSHINRTSFDMGQLVPIVCLPTLPRDKFEVTVSNFIRAVATKVPLMDGIDLKINHFYVPNRILWNGFEQFISLARNGRINTDSLPLISLQNADSATDPKYPNGRLADYLNLGDVDLPSGEGQGVNALPFLAYQKIYLDHYAPKRWVNYENPDGSATTLNQLRDRLEDIRQGNGAEVLAVASKLNELTQLRKVNWNHDYFTNALPSPTLFEDQKIPLFTSFDPDALIYDNYQGVFEVDGGELRFASDSGDPVGKSNFEALATIRDLRKTISLQHYLEKLQQSGGGYLETMKIHWNQDLPNDLLQRSEYLGGSVTNIFNNEVESNADTTETGGQGLGALAGKPIGGGTDDTIYMDSDEFGVYMAIAHVVPKRSYTSAVHRMWLDLEPTEWPNPDFENIGDQAVYRFELTGNFNQTTIWGFVPRYSQFKTALDRFSGEMRHTLKDWHLGTFKSELLPFPTISPEFLDCNPREDIFQVPNEPDKLLATFKFDIKAMRPLQNTSQPGIGYI